MAPGRPDGQPKRLSVFEITAVCVFAAGCLVQVSGCAVWMDWAYREYEMETWASGLLAALFDYSVDNFGYPPDLKHAEDAFDPKSLEPLRSQGYLAQLRKPDRFLRSARVLAYENTQTDRDSPSGFWLILEGTGSRARCYLVADTDRFPGSENVRLHGVFGLSLKGLTPLIECPERSGPSSPADD